MSAQSEQPAGRWRMLAILSTGVLLAMSPWLTGAAVAPAIRSEWALSALEVALLAVAVQFGFAFGAISLAATGAPDVLPARWLFLAGAALAAGSNLGFALLARDLPAALPFRFATGAALAAVYPVGMKVIVGWFRAERGLAVGILIGALTIGTALPYLFSALGTLSGIEWRLLAAATSPVALVGGILVSVGAHDGPFDVPSSRFSPRVALRALREPAVRLANLGYLGHMWELYGMWTWMPLFLAASFAAAGADPSGAGLAAFAVVGAGGAGCIVAGAFADRVGRSTTTIVAMAISGSSAVAAGLLFGAPPVIVVAVCIVWGITIIADSAQFSSAVSELAPPGTAGSALSLQVALGFALTGITILGIGALTAEDAAAWRLAFALLALGPLVGIVAMWRLRRRPESVRMAGGRR